MNPITKALDEVFFRIPRDVLDLAFIEPYRRYRDAPTNIKEAIRYEVIQQRVLVDVNLTSGEEKRIPLDDVPSEVTDNGYTRVYRIPKRMTDGRSISQVFDVSYGNAYTGMPGYGIHSYVRSGQGLQVAANIMEAHLRNPYNGTARVRLLGDNVIMVKDTAAIPQNVWLRCALDYDDTISNLKVRAYHAFCKLVELAVKSYIYNNTIIPMDVDQLRGGQSVGRIKEVIDGYSDAETMYQEYLKETWPSVAFQNDQESMERFTALLIGGSR